MYNDRFFHKTFGLNSLTDTNTKYLIEYGYLIKKW